MNNLLEQKADMTGVVVGLDQERNRYVDFSDFLYMDQERLIYKRPVLESDMAGFLKPYTTTVRGCPLLTSDSLSFFFL